MHTNEMRPRVIKQDFQSNPTQRRLFENGESKILVAIKDTHAFISHNLGISWKQIDKVSGSKLEIIQTVEKRIIISDPDTDRLYLIDGRGNVIKEIVFKLEAFWNISVHPNDTNAILISNIQTNLYDECDEYYEQSTHYYTKDGGASGFVVQGQCDHCEYDLDVLNGIIHYEFIAGGARDLIYEYSAYDDGYTAYALNFFSESPLEFTRFPFVVRQSQGIFYGIKDNKELHVSKDGVNFEHIKFPPSPIHSSPRGSEKNTGSSYLVPCFYRGYFDTFDFSNHKIKAKRRTKDSLFLQKIYRTNSDPHELPWVTLFRCDVQRKEIKFMLDFCYDFMVVSAEEGIIIANSVTNPQEYAYEEVEPIIRTVISFNDGADWEPLIGPNGTDFNINISSSLDRISGDNPSSTSMMIVQGKEGPIESYRSAYSLFPDSIALPSTYMTNDSGRSWRKIHDKVMLWMFGDNDNIIVMYSGIYDYILYSLDGGMEWQKLTGIPRGSYLECSSRNSKRFWLDICSISFDPADQEEQ